MSDNSDHLLQLVSPVTTPSGTMNLSTFYCPNGRDLTTPSTATTQSTTTTTQPSTLSTAATTTQEEPEESAIGPALSITSYTLVPSTIFSSYEGNRRGWIRRIWRRIRHGAWSIRTKIRRNRHIPSAELIRVSSLDWEDVFPERHDGEERLPDGGTFDDADRGTGAPNSSNSSSSSESLGGFTFSPSPPPYYVGDTLALQYLSPLEQRVLQESSIAFHRQRGRRPFACASSGGEAPVQSSHARPRPSNSPGCDNMNPGFVNRSAPGEPSLHHPRPIPGKPVNSNFEFLF